MTRKDFKLIARVIAANENKSLTDLESATLTMLAEDMAQALGDENARFDRARFLTACGLSPEFDPSGYVMEKDDPAQQKYLNDE